MNMASWYLTSPYPCRNSLQALDGELEAILQSSAVKELKKRKIEDTNSKKIRGVTPISAQRLTKSYCYTPIGSSSKKSTAVVSASKIGKRKRVITDDDDEWDDEDGKGKAEKEDEESDEASQSFVDSEDEDEEEDDDDEESLCDSDDSDKPIASIRNKQKQQQHSRLKKTSKDKPPSGGLSSVRLSPVSSKKLEASEASVSVSVSKTYKTGASKVMITPHSSTPSASNSSNSSSISSSSSSTSNKKPSASGVTPKAITYSQAITPSSNPRYTQDNSNSSPDNEISKKQEVGLPEGVFGNGNHDHDSLEFLQPATIKDMDRKKPSHPDYNPRTVYVPPDFLKAQV